MIFVIEDFLIFLLFLKISDVFRFLAVFLILI